MIERTKENTQQTEERYITGKFVLRVCYCILDLEQLRNGDIALSSAEESSSGAKRPEEKLVGRDFKMFMCLFSEQEAKSEESLKKRPKVDKCEEKKSKRKPRWTLFWAFCLKNNAQLGRKSRTFKPRWA